MRSVLDGNKYVLMQAVLGVTTSPFRVQQDLDDAVVGIGDRMLPAAFAVSSVAEFILPTICSFVKVDDYPASDDLNPCVYSKQEVKFLTQLVTDLHRSFKKIVASDFCAEKGLQQSDVSLHVKISPPASSTEKGLVQSLGSFMEQFCESLVQRQGEAVKKTCDIAASTIRVMLTELLKLAVDLVSENFIESVESIESFELRNKTQRQVSQALFHVTH
jgi:hypothetical protein